MPVIAAGVLGTIATPAAVLAAPDRSELERLYLQGSDLQGVGEYAHAAEVWTGLLQRMPETPANSSSRESVLIQVLGAHIDAFEHQLGADGKKDIEHLHAGKRVADAYLAQFAATYGEARSPSSAVADKIRELEFRIETAPAAPVEPEHDVGPCLQPCLQPCLSPPPPLPTCQGCGGKDDPMTAALFGLLPLAAFPRRRRDALARLSARLPPDVVARLEARCDDDDDDDHDPDR